MGIGLVNDPKLTVGDLLERWLRDVAAVKPKMADLVPHTGFLAERLMRLSRVYPVLAGGL